MWVLLAAAAVAQPKVDCDNAMTNADMLYCAVRDYRAADAAMNRAYQSANAVAVSLDIGRDKRRDKRMGYRDALLASQRAWLKFRDAQCLVEGFGARGGSMEPLLVTACQEELTKARTKQLQDLVKLMRD
jgi:uncharacterized protein YecT (DUF1311 family)